MAGFAFPKTIQEINDQLNEVTGTIHSHRTVERDVWLLERMGLVTLNGLRPTKPHTPGANTFKLNLSRTERLQAVAIDLLDKEK